MNKSQTYTKNQRPLLAAVLFLAALGIPSLSQAASITWDGGGDATNWSDGTNWTGTPDNTAPGATDTAIFSDVAAGTQTTVVDASFIGAINFLTINQSTTTATNAISLARNLAINDSAATSSITYGSTISNAAMINWDLNGNTLFLSRNASSGNFNNLYGTFTLDTDGSRIGTDRQFGTNSVDILTMNFGSGSNLAVINATADATIGVFRTATTTSRQDGPSAINIGVGSQVNVSNGALLNFFYGNRSGGVAAGANIITLNNAGTINVASGSTVAVEYNQVNNTDKTINIGLTNQATGTVNHNGTVKMDLHESGTGTITNQGTWIAGTSAIILGEVDSSGTGDNATIAMTNASGGIIQGIGATASIDYNPSQLLRINQTLAITNQGIISPGAGSNGSGLASVGTLSMTDTNATFSGVDATLRIDLGGLTAGTQFDVLSLTNGALTLDADSKIALFYVNSFNGTIGDSWTILNYTSATTTGFNLASALSVTGGSGDAANAANYSLTFGGASATLTLVPEPGTLVLFGIAGLSLVVLGRRRR